MSRVPVRGGQSGQMLVGVMVLLAVVLLLGTAMALGVSTSLHQVGQGATQDAARYAAESAVARGQATVQPPNSDNCGAAAGAGSLNGQTLQAQPCYITAVDAGTGKIRYSSQVETVLGTGKCLTVPVNGGTAARGDSNDNNDEDGGPKVAREGRAWSTLAWRPTTGQSASLTVSVNDEKGCALDNDGDPTIGCPASSASSPAYIRCVFQMDPNKNYWIKLSNQGGPAIVSDFVVRDATAGHDCVATVIGQSQGATDEGDLILPGTPAVNPTSCGLVGAGLGIQNRLLP